VRSRAWDDEDARLLASAFNTLTESVARFQREAAQKERLSSLGRLSTVIAHEIRNPLMIIRATLTSLRRDQVNAADRLEAAADIDEETTRLNNLVSDVLDFAKPMRFDLAAANLNDVCRASAAAAWAGHDSEEVHLQLDPAMPMAVTDAERMRTALINILTNARHAVQAAASARKESHADQPGSVAVASRPGRLELANRGTLFLDEIGDIPLEVQPKLLRVLQEREFERLGSTRTQRVDVRIVAATNRDLERMVEDGSFRSDLYYRLNVFPITVPPLRERAEDIPALALHFVTQCARRLGRPVPSVSPAVMDVLKRWTWPGNIRELQNVIERGVIQSTSSDFVLPLQDVQPRTPASPSGSKTRNSTMVSPNTPSLSEVKSCTSAGKLPETALVPSSGSP